MRALHTAPFLAALAAVMSACVDQPADITSPSDPAGDALLDDQLRAVLADREFTGRIESTLVVRLGRPIDTDRAELGRLLFFDPITSLTGDNSCSGCHGPNVSFNDSKSVAIGVGNNGIVGPGRLGPHNKRRAPTVLNAAFYPRLMWEGRFESLSLDPFDNSRGFMFPAPDGLSLSHMEHLLGAQAFTPVIARPELTGFDFPGDHVAIRGEVVRRIDAIEAYRTLFSEVFPDVEAGAPIRFEHIALALAEFEFTLVRADAPLDRFARGEPNTMTDAHKRGALLFFRLRDGCAECHSVKGYANEMFSDFESHVLAVPQVVPTVGNIPLDGPGANEDFGLEGKTGSELDRYKFRASPLRNVAFQPTFMHNGAYVCLEEAIRHHVDVDEVLRTYTTARLDHTLQAPLGPIEPVLSRLHHLIRTPRRFADEEIRQITAFVRYALTDEDAHPDALRSLVPATVPSGIPVHDFEFDTPLPECPG